MSKRTLSEYLDAAEIKRIETLVSQCVGRPLSIDQEESGAGGRLLGIIFHWHEETADRRARYFARLQKKPDATEWQLLEINVMGDLQFGDGGIPLSFHGHVTAAEAAEVRRHVQQCWDRYAGLGPLCFGSLTSSRLPPLAHCPFDVEPLADNIHYRLTAGNDRAPPPPSPEVKGDRARGVTLRSQVTVRRQVTRVHASSAKVMSIDLVDGVQGAFRFRLRRDGEAAPLAITEIHCAWGADECDPRVLARLQAGVERPPSEAEKAERMAAVCAAIPPDFAAARVRDIHYDCGGGRESLSAQLEEVSLGPNRKAMSWVRCGRPLGGGAPWRCEHALLSLTQRIPAHGITLRFMGRSGKGIGAFSEAALEDLVDRLASHAGGLDPRAPLIVMAQEQGYRVKLFGDGLKEILLDEALRIVERKK